MKNFLLISGLFAMLACQTENPVEYSSFGEAIDANGISSFTELESALAENDSVQIKIEGEIDEICQMKGCWMTLKSESSDPVRVTFKDYGFFVPKDAQNRNTIIEGVATREVLSPDKARHYAEDAGVEYDSTRTYSEISFVAKGVLIADATESVNESSEN